MQQEISKPIMWLTTKQVMAKTGLSRTKLYELRLEDPTFPKPIKFGPGTGRAANLRWVESELDEWMQGHHANRG